MSDTGRLIHCNPEVLHAPGECSLCDEWGSDRQEQRIASNTPFTPNLANGWQGNVALVYPRDDEEVEFVEYER